MTLNHRIPLMETTNATLLMVQQYQQTLNAYFEQIQDSLSLLNHYYWESPEKQDIIEPLETELLALYQLFQQNITICEKIINAYHNSNTSIVKQLNSIAEIIERNFLYAENTFVQFAKAICSAK